MGDGDHSNPVCLPHDVMKKEITGYGTCPKCDSQTTIYNIIMSPFPEEEQTEVRETCRSCNFEYQKNFSSTNATVMQDWSIKREMIDRKVDQAFKKISLYSQKKQLEQATQNLSSSEFQILYMKLEEQRTLIKTKSTSEASEIIEKARGDVMFLGEGLPLSMADYYDNEVSAVYRDMGEELSAITNIKELLKEIEQGNLRNI